MKRHILTITFLLIILSGCATAPKPYIASLNTNYNFDVRDNFYILNQALEITFPEYTVVNGCLPFKTRSYSRLAEVCYSIDNNKIQRNARTYTSLNIHLNDWFESIVSKQHILEDNYLMLASQHVEYLHQQKIETEGFKQKVASLKIDFKDETGKIPSRVMNELRNSLQVIKNQPQIKVKYNTTFGNYKLKTTSNLPLNINYSNYADNITVIITGYKINSIPKSFELSDSNLNVKAVYDFDSAKVDNLIFTNNSNDFITIDIVAGYYDTKVRTNLLKDALTLPPMSEKTIEWRDINTFPIQYDYEQFLDQEMTQYGFSINYKLANKETSNTLSKIDNLKIK